VCQRPWIVWENTRLDQRKINWISNKYQRGRGGLHLEHSEIFGMGMILQKLSARGAVTLPPSVKTCASESRSLTTLCFMVTPLVTVLRPLFFRLLCTTLTWELTESTDLKLKNWLLFPQSAPLDWTALRTTYHTNLTPDLALYRHGIRGTVPGNLTGNLGLSRPLSVFPNIRERMRGAQIRRRYSTALRSHDSV
jgi:hypothetical protein